MPIDSTGDRIAIDTGVWLEGLVYGGSAEELVKMAVTGRVSLITSEGLLEELSRTLERLDFSVAAIEQVDSFVRDCATMVKDPAADEPTSTGRSPRRVLEVARRGGASAIATTPRSELLRLQAYEGIPIVRIV